MPKIKVKGQNGSNRRVPNRQTDRHTHSHTHWRYQKYYLPC